MNQILITEKIYITPELKKKKRMYKFNFIISIILIVVLFSFYAYAEYDRNKTADISQEILLGTSDALLKVSVCKFWGSNPNEIGNLCIAGHNYRNKRFFSKVPTLKVGDIIEVTDLNNNTLKYSIYDKYTVDPTDTSCTSQITNGKKIVTLITCTDDSKQRVIVQAEAI